MEPPTTAAVAACGGVQRDVGDRGRCHSSPCWRGRTGAVHDVVVAHDHENSSAPAMARASLIRIITVSMPAARPRVDRAFMVGPDWCFIVLMWNLLLSRADHLKRHAPRMGRYSLLYDPRVAEPAAQPPAGPPRRRPPATSRTQHPRGETDARRTRKLNARHTIQCAARSRTRLPQDARARTRRRSRGVSRTRVGTAPTGTARHPKKAR